MALADLTQIEQLFVCPRCFAPVTASEERYVCTGDGCRYATEGFPRVGRHPVLIDSERSTISANAVPDAETGVNKPMSLKRRIGIELYRLAGHENTVAARQARWIRDQIGPNGTVLFVGGGQIGAGMETLYDDPHVQVIGFDIFPSKHVQFVGDASAIPLADASVNAVVIQAVLHAMLDPYQTAREIHRVLRPEGILYADSPFLQPVVDSAYDFHRFTESGHRWVFRDFSCLECGVVSGVGDVYATAFDYVVRALSRSSALGRLARLPLIFSGRLIDRVADKRIAQDGASSVFFLGRKAERAITPHELIQHYHGAQRA